MKNPPKTSPIGPTGTEALEVPNGNRGVAPFGWG